MNKKDMIITISRKELKDKNLKLLFNNVIIDILPSIPLSHEICPGIFVTYHFLFNQIFQKIDVKILNKRDSIILFIENNSNRNATQTTLYKSTQSFHNVLPIINLELTIPIDSIHYPMNETGGDGERCKIKEMMKDLDIYPESLNKLTKEYNLFSYEDIYSLPDSIPELKEVCREFCFNRNRENQGANQGLNIVNSFDKKKAASRLINKRHDKVTLSTLKDNTLTITSGNHRVCFLKRFKDEFHLNSLNFNGFQQISKDEINLYTNKYSAQGYYNEMLKKGFSKEESLKVLSDGLSPAELYKLILAKSIERCTTRKNK